MSKFFLIDPYQNPLSQEDKIGIENDLIERRGKIYTDNKEVNNELLESEENLKHILGRVAVKVDTELKNWHSFSDGTKIRRERRYNEFNRRITEPVNAIVISAENIPQGSEILIGHNALHDVNRILNYTSLSGKIESTDVKYYSLPEDDCFAWIDKEGVIHPMKNYSFALRVFKPYEGALSGIKPTIIKDVLFITTGEFKGQVVHTLKAADYTIIYQGKDGREAQVIRCRHFEDDYDEKEEIVALAHDLTEKLNSGKLLIGLTESDAKTLKESVSLT
jgi:hypothetical protein